MGEALRAGDCPSNSDSATDCTQKNRDDERRIFFRDLSEFLWPEKTAWALSDLTGKKLRMVRYWMAGDCEIPAIAERVVYQEIMRRLS